MNADRWSRIKALFDEALERPPTERPTWLTHASSDDPTLQADVERLLRADERAGDFLDVPARIDTSHFISSGREVARLLTPGQTLGHYENVALLGAGGMGTVYRARDTVLRRTVAIKLLHGVASGGLPAGLLREARAASALNHPHICTIHGIEEADGHAFIVMEYVEGDSLLALNKTGLTMEQVRQYGVQIAGAIAHAHEHGVIHRDLKCANVLITPQGRAKVLDFGIAAQALQDEVGLAVDSPAKAVASLTAWAGTLPYMAPERLGGASGDARSDVWALGVMLYEMAAGRPPFTGDASTLTAAILDNEPAPLPETIPPELADIIRRCVARDPARRYQTAAEVHAALEAIGRPVRTRFGFLHAPAAAAVALMLLLVAAVLGLLQVRSGTMTSPRAAHVSDAARPTTLAVLPFRPLVTAEGDAVLELGMADTLITKLSSVPGITVRPTSAVLRYMDRTQDAIAAGRDLRVEAIVEGTLQRTGGQLHVSARLFSVADGRSLWGQTFDAANDDVFAVQSGIARQVAEALVPQLGGQAWSRLVQPGTDDLLAYRAYLEGRYEWSRRTEAAFAKAIAHFQDAIARDRGYAPAYAGLADCYTLLAIWGAGSASDTVARAKEAALRAVALDDRLAEGHGSAALVRWVYDWNPDEADREFRKALELNPNYATARQWYAYFLASRRRFEEAIAEIRRAHDLDPLSLSIRTDVGEIHAWARRYDGAITELQGVLDVDPNFLMARNLLGLTYLLQERLPEGIAALERARRIDDSPRIVSTLGFGYGLAGNREQARAVIDDLQAMAQRRYVSPFTFALVHAGMGDRDQAFAWLQRARRERSDTMVILDVYPWLDGLRTDPRFADLLNRTKVAAEN